MSARSTYTSPRSNAGFTLLEVLCASAMFLVLVSAIYSVFHGALNLRESSHEALEASVLA